MTAETMTSAMTPGLPGIDHRSFTDAERRAVFDALVRAFTDRSAPAGGTRWQWLEAAHIVGQWRLALHWRSHWLMLRFAIALRDWREAAGQLLRLALVPPGHLLQRLPAGNIGRATVPVLKPMPPQPALEALVAYMLSQVRGDAAAESSADSHRQEGAI